ncbi:MAG TPA: DUF4388 domain-containing protein [Polyangiaceae bacterium]|jgi:hypothetical protein|nr:DUF4388 domain-containing protein [Polyangiaceae bacterium]
MDDERHELVRIDATGTAHPLGKTASQQLRARQGSFRLMPTPAHLVVLRFVGEDGKRNDQNGPVFRLAGEITAPGALCDIVGLVGQASWSGELLVLDGEITRSMFFERGHVIGAQSSSENERIGEVLYRYGALSREQVHETARAVTTDLRFGEAAVMLGFLTRERLFQLITRQTEEIVFAVLLVGDGMFYFLDNFDPSRIASRQNLQISALLMEGVRRMDETRYFRERIPSDQHLPERVDDKVLPPEEAEFQKIYEAINGQRSVAEICRVVGLSEFEVTQALFQLVQVGRVIVHAPRPTGPVAIVALFNEAIAMILDEVDAVGRGTEVREQLSSFATGAGIYDALFRRAGPSRTGTLDPERISENVAVMVGPEQAESMLAQWLYEYISFAMFVADPHVRHAGEVGARREEKFGPMSVRPVPQMPERPSLAKRIAELIAPLTPKN